MRTTLIGAGTTGLQRLLPSLSEWPQRFRDGRRKVQIPVSVIGQAVVEMVPRNQSSLLQVDLEGREPEVKQWFGSDREMLVSDSTRVRSLETFELEPVRRILAETAERLGKRGWLSTRLPSGQKKRLGIVDGSCWGGFQGSVLMLPGGRIDPVAGYRMSPGQGHELATSRALLDDMCRRLHPGFLDLLVADGLYLTGPDLKRARDHWGCHLLVKNPSEELTVVRDARDLFDGNPREFQGDLEHVEGFDAERGIRYEITAAAGFSWQGLTLKVGRVREWHVKPKPGRPAESVFWVVTTDLTLSAEDMREVAHLRWGIENRTFRRLSHLVESKRRLTDSDHVREALLGLWFIGLNLLGIAIALLPRSALPKIFQTAKRTWRWVCRLYRALTARRPALVTN